MWMDIAQQDGDQEPQRNSEDEDTVYDRTNPFTKSSTKNPFEQNGESSGVGGRSQFEADSPQLELRSMLHEQDTRCGIFTWRPHFIQRFANKGVFSVIFTIVGILHASVWSYYTASISTIEKRFRMDSITSGVLLFSNELAQLLIAVLFSYFNLRRHRHKLLTLGVVLASISCFLMASPHFFMGSGETALKLVNSEGPPIEPTFNIVPNPSREGFEFEQEMKQAVPLIQLQKRQANLTNTSVTTTQLLNISVLTSTPTTEGTTVNINTDVVTVDLQDNLTSTSSSSPPSTSTSPPSTSPSPSPTTSTTPPTTPEVDSTTSTSLPPSLANDEMISIWPTCQSSVEHINSTIHPCDSEPSFQRKLAFTFIFLSNLIFGLASMLFLFSGGPFSEPTTIFPNEIPRIFSITLSIRLIGSFFGYLFAWTCLSSFINPFETPIQIDNRFLGAYWLGWISLSITFTIFALILSLFPNQSPREFLKKRSLTHDTGLGMLLIPSIAPFFGGAELKSANVLPSILNIPTAFQGLIRNKVYLLLTLSSITHIFCSVGYLTFLPKYLEFMFRLKASDAALLTGLSTVPFQVAGLMLGGAFIARYLPSSKEISHWSCVVGALQIVSLMVMSFLGCATNKMDVSFVGGGEGEGQGHCSVDCDCDKGPPLPVCDLYTGTTYYSGCHAGCESVRNQSGVFGDCSCLGDEEGTLVEGWCPGDGCGNGLVAFLVFVCLAQFLRGSGVVGRMLLGYKAVQADQRTAIIGLTLFILSVFALIPSPIVFGSLFEAACLVREEGSCEYAHINGTEDSGGTMGNCWLYSDSSLRFIYNLGAAAFMVIAFVLDAVLWKNKEVHELRLYDGELRQLTSQSGGEGGNSNGRFASVSLT